MTVPTSSTAAECDARASVAGGIVSPPFAPPGKYNTTFIIHITKKKYLVSLDTNIKSSIYIYYLEFWRKL